METMLNVLHVLTAVFLIGPMAILPMIGLRSVRARRGEQASALARGTAFTSWASLLVAVFGFGVLGMADPKYELSVTTPWVLASLTLYLVALAINLLVVVPALRRASQRAVDDRSQTATPGSSSLYIRLGVSSGATLLLLAAVVVLMVWKP